MTAPPRNGFHLLPIHPDGTVEAFGPPWSDDLAPMIEMTRAFYAESGYLPPWIAYLATQDGEAVGGGAEGEAPAEGGRGDAGRRPSAADRSRHRPRYFVPAGAGAGAGMIGPGTGVRVYLACGATDMRNYAGRMIMRSHQEADGLRYSIQHLMRPEPSFSAT